MSDLLRIKKLLNRIKEYQIRKETLEQIRKMAESIKFSDKNNVIIDNRIRYLKNNNINIDYKII